MKQHLLRIGPHLSLPAEEAVESVFGVLGKRGRGKSGYIKVFLEEMMKVGLPFVALDPVGVVWGIRSSADGKRESGYKVLVVGGEHADVGLERRAGADVAKAIVETNVSCVIDFSQESKRVYREFVRDFSETLYRVNDTPRHVVIEEAPELVPQRLRPDMTECFEAVERLVSRARNRGIGVTLVSQRAATIAKDVLTQVDHLIVFGLASPQDRKALREWVEAKADIEKLREFDAGLAGLERQQAWIWSPESLNLFQSFTVRTMTTFHPDKTHLRRMGLLATKPVETDVSGIVVKLGNKIRTLAAQKQEASGLTAEVYRLRREVARLRTKTDCSPPAVVGLSGRSRKLLDRSLNSLAHIIHIGQELKRDIEKLATPATPGMPPPPQTAPDPAVGVDNGDCLPKAERLILTALAQHGPSTQQKVAVITGYAINGGGFRNALGALRSKGYIQDISSGLVAITDSGIATLGQWTALPHGRDLLGFWVGRLGKCEREILKVLMYAYPASKNIAQLAEQTESRYAADGGGFRNAIGHLRTLELIEGRSEVKLADVFFEDP